MKLREVTFAYMLMLPALALLTFFFFFPCPYNIALSLQRISLFQMAGEGGKFIGLKNFVELLRDPSFYRVLINALLWLTGITVLLRLVMGAGLALLLNSTALKRFRLSGLARILIFIPWGVPPVVAVAIWKWMFHSRYGFVNLFLENMGLIHQPIYFLTSVSIIWVSIITVIVWRELPFAVIAFLAGLQSIPLELYEAARIDGAGWFSQFWYITLPFLRPVTVIIGFMITIWTFSNFVYVWLFTRGGPGDFTQVLGTKVYFESFVNFRVGYGATVGVVITAIMIIFGMLYFRFLFKPGLT